MRTAEYTLGYAKLRQGTHDSAAREDHRGGAGGFGCAPSRGHGCDLAPPRPADFLLRTADRGRTHGARLMATRAAAGRPRGSLVLELCRVDLPAACHGAHGRGAGQCEPGVPLA